MPGHSSNLRTPSRSPGLGDLPWVSESEVKRTEEMAHRMNVKTRS